MNTNDTTPVQTERCILFSITSGIWMDGIRLQGYTPTCRPFAPRISICSLISMYVGAAVGTWVGSGIGTRWPPTNAGPESTTNRHLSLKPSRVTCASHFHNESILLTCTTLLHSEYNSSVKGAIAIKNSTSRMVLVLTVRNTQAADHLHALHCRLSSLQIFLAAQRKLLTESHHSSKKSESPESTSAHTKQKLRMGTLTSTSPTHHYRTSQWMTAGDQPSKVLPYYMHSFHYTPLQDA